MTTRLGFAILLGLFAAACGDDGGGTGGGAGGAAATTSSGSASTSPSTSRSAGPGGDDASAASTGDGPSSSSTDAAGTGGGPSASATGTGGDASSSSGPGTGGGSAGSLAVGDAALSQLTYGEEPDPVTIGTFDFATEDGSFVLASLARGGWGSVDSAAPRDSLGNTYEALGDVHDYAAWPGSATSLYLAEDATGGDDHVVMMECGPGDEATLTAVEVRGATRVVDDSWVERDAAPTITSEPVHVDGPALLVAWWWGSGGVRPVGTSHVAEPGDGFTILPEATGLVSLSASGYIQVAVAARAVDAAGDYTITWTTDDEGAQLYLVALQ